MKVDRAATVEQTINGTWKYDVTNSQIQSSSVPIGNRKAPVILFQSFKWVLESNMLSSKPWIIQSIIDDVVDGFARLSHLTQFFP